MGKRGHPRREPRPNEALETCLRLAQEVAPPLPKGRSGRPWHFLPSFYLGLTLSKRALSWLTPAFWGLTYRATVAHLQDFRESPGPSYQSLARYAQVHLDPKVVAALMGKVAEGIERQLPLGEAPPFVPDG